MGAGSRFADWLQSWQQPMPSLPWPSGWPGFIWRRCWYTTPCRCELGFSLIALFHQWRNGRVDLTPFGHLPEEAACALLGTDRQHYAVQPVIWLRYAVLYVLVIVVLGFIQWPHFRATRQHNPIAHESD